MPYTALTSAANEAADRLEKQGYKGWISPGYRFPAAEDMPLYKPFLKQPEPETTAGRYASRAGEATGASAVPAGTALRLAKTIEMGVPAAAPTIRETLLRPIAENPGKMTAIDVAAATGAGGASQATEEAGGGPGAQGIAGMVGGFASPVAGTMLMRG